MEVISSTRVETLDGHIRTNVVVEWKRDDRMNMVTSNVRLTFHYERRRRNENNTDENSKQSQIIYTIDVAKDYGPRERLLTIEVWALGEGPSVEAAEPLLDEEEWKEDDDDFDAMDASTEDVATTKQEDTKKSDRYAAYMDPETLADLLTWTQLDMDEYTVFFFLMTFPFYEHEWDLVGFVLDTVFAESIDEGNGDDYDEYDENGSDVVSIQEVSIQEVDSEDDDSSSL